MWSIRKDFVAVRYAKLSPKSKVAEALLLGTFKIKLDKAIVGECKITVLLQQEDGLKLFSSSTPWSWLLARSFLSRKLKVFPR